MYLDFYDLYRAPFHITPDPDFFFHSPVHREALAAFIYGVEMRKGFIAITGEVGTGKTTIIRTFLKTIDSQTIRPIYLFNANVTFHELLGAILEELQLVPESNAVSGMLRQLQAAFTEGYGRQHNCVLIIDEAQNMPIDTLQNLHMLSNLETVKEKLIQIILIGQPELNAKLNRPELRQIKQRIALRVTLNPLTDRESREYVDHRLALASNTPRKRFTRAALRRIIRHAKGRPRELNILCDNALVAGYGYQKAPITAKMVKEIIADYEGVGFPRFGLWKLVGTTAIIAGIALSLGIYSSYSLPLISRDSDHHGHIRNPDAPEIPNPAKKQHTGSDDRTAPPFPFDNIATTDETAKTHRDPIVEALSATPEKTADRSAPSGAEKTEDPEPLSAEPPVDREKEPRFPIERVVRDGDCFSKLCAEIYGTGRGNDPQLIDWVKRHNPHIRNIHKLSIGQTIVFPVLREGVFSNDQNL